MALCVPIALIYAESIVPWIVSVAINISVSAFCLYYGKEKNSEKVSLRDGYLIVAIAWFCFSLFGTLPFILTGSIPNFVDAFFESTSGITTNGATILGDIESMPSAILFWRSLLHWIGGLGIILLIIVVLPSLKINTQQIVSLESSHREKILPKTKDIGVILIKIYIVLTLLEIIFLAVGDMNLFDSICHSFSTIATGGFSNYNDSFASTSTYTQSIVTIFMFVAGVSFTLYYFLSIKKYSRVLHNEELWVYTAVVLFFGILMFLILQQKSSFSSGEALLHGMFQTISIITTTGFATFDYSIWSKSIAVISLVIMFSGACSGSTSGGIKINRHIIVVKNISNAIFRMHHPNVIKQVTIDGKAVSDNTNRSVLTFMALFFIVFFLGYMVLSLSGCDIITAFSSSISALGCVGPALGSAGPMGNFGSFYPSAKIFMSLLMIVGRLELMTFFIIFSKTFNRP